MIYYTRMPQAKDPLDKLSKLEKERVLTKTIGEENEKLEAMGQESNRKAAKWVQEEGKRQRKEEQIKSDDAMTKLWDARGKVFTYRDKLLEEMKREMENWSDELPEGFSWFPMFTSKGLVMWLKNRNGDWFAKGLKISGEPKYDLNGVARLIIGAVEEANKQVEPIKKPNGLILPYK